MSDVKWIQIVTDIFDDEKMAAIETLPDGYSIEIVWFKVLCLAGKCNSNGILIISDKLAYTDEMLSKIFRMELGVIQRAFEIFQRLEMITLTDNAYMVSNWSKYQNVAGMEKIKEQNRIRQQRKREKDRLALEEKTSEEEMSRDSHVTSNVKNNVICSYSYSNNSNYNNYIYIINNTDYSNKDYILNNNILLESIADWMKYKDELKPKASNHYNTEKAIKTLLTQFVNIDRTYGTNVVRFLIDQSIMNNWKGIQTDLIEKYLKNPSLYEDVKPAKRKVEDY